MKEERLYLEHMRESCERILDFTRSGKAEFLSNRQIQDAVIRNFEILDEAAKHVSEITRSQASEIPWRLLSGFRDVLIHQYASVDLQEVWKRVEFDLPPVHKALGVLLNRE